ncbi:hypothetical protein MKX08_001304 [Trichoderma sp. CBMAI-0020]|nr:hypothetical protein MKX08_001304 [Trichoderma sp. CBMAI-0020]
MSDPIKVTFPSSMLTISGELHQPAIGSLTRKALLLWAKAAVIYLATLGGKVDPERISILGICASGGYTLHAAQIDTRIKDLGTVSAVCIGPMARNGLIEINSKESSEAITGALRAAADWRTAHAKNTKTRAPRMFETGASTCQQMHHCSLIGHRILQVRDRFKVSAPE